MDYYIIIHLICGLFAFFILKSDWKAHFPENGSCLQIFHFMTLMYFLGPLGLFISLAATHQCKYGIKFNFDI